MFEFEDTPDEDAALAVQRDEDAGPRAKRAEAEVDFQVVDAFSESCDGRAALLLFGRDADGQSHLVRVPDFCAYFYVERGGDAELPPAPIVRECGEVVAIEAVERRPLFYYHPAPVAMWKVVLRSPDKMRAAEKALPGRALYETDVPHATQALRDAGVGAMQWARVRGSRAPGTRCDWAWDVPFAQLAPTPDAREGNAPLRIASFDIECLSGGGFPSAERGDPIITISVCHHVAGTAPETARSVVFQLNACDPVAGAQVVVCPTERALLERFADHVVAIDPDVLTGYNINGFDWKYVLTRAHKLGVERMAAIGRAPGAATRFYDKNFQSKGAGTRKQTIVLVPGRIVFDVFMLILATESLREYSLNSVAEKHLGDRKDDVPHTEIPRLFRTDAATRAVLAKYCVKDSHLVLRLIAARAYFANLAEMARVTRVFINALLTRGQTVKVRTLLVYDAAARGIALPARGLPANHDGYQGATVLDPVVGLHTRPVATLDFASLYPSIMRAHNMSHDTLLPPAADPARLGLAEADVERFPETGACFVRSGVARGLLPAILDRTIAARAAVRARQKHTDKADPMHAVLEGQQLAMKLICNSIYGFTGAATEKLACQAISSSVTAVGRRMIQMTADETVRTYCTANGYAHNAHVLYGDSVTGDTPCLVRQGRLVHVMRIDEMAAGPWGAWHGDKEQAACVLEIWSSAGWTAVERVVRHRVPAEKEIVEVCTHTGVAKVTADHSLLRPDGSVVAARDVAPGAELLHADFAGDAAQADEVDESEAWLMGLFFIYGSCTVFNNVWYIASDDRAMLLQALPCAERAYPGVRFAVHAVPTRDNGFLLSAVRDKAIARVYRGMFYDVTGNKRVPACILNAGDAARRAFFAGYYSSAGRRTGCVQCEVRGQIGAAGLFRVMRSIGYAVSIAIRADRKHIYRLTTAAGPGAQYKNPAVVKTVRPVAHGDCYVYDLQTANHHFQAGAGNLIVHNTDSVMVDFGVETVAEAMELGRAAAAHITTLFRDPIKLEFEKVYYAFLLLAKKRYAGYYWTRPDKPDYLDSKGLETKRRDPPRLVEEVVKAVLGMLLDDRSPAAALAHARRVADDLHMNRVPLYQLIMSKKLSKPPDAYVVQPVHVQLRERMRARGVSPLPEIGSRIQFVLVAGARGAKTSELGEDPLHAWSTHQPPDAAKYLDILRKPLERILSPFLRGEDVFAGTGRHRAIAAPSGPIAAWLRRGEPCAACRKPQPVAADGLCAACDAQRDASRQLITERMLAAGRTHETLWAGCRECAGDRAPACANYVCDRRFAREEADAAVARCEKEMAAAKLEW